MAWPWGHTKSGPGLYITTFLGASVYMSSTDTVTSTLQVRAPDGHQHESAAG